MYELSMDEVSRVGGGGGAPEISGLINALTSFGIFALETAGKAGFAAMLSSLQNISIPDAQFSAPQSSSGGGHKK